MTPLLVSIMMRAMSDALEKRVDCLEAEILRLQSQIYGIQGEVKHFLKRYLSACPACKKEFDLLVNHYSIGLFDNLVYVKCPHCNKSMPVVDQEDGTVSVILE